MNLIKLLISLIIILAITGCSTAKYYESQQSVNALTGESVRTIRVVRLDPIEGAVGTGMQMLMGSSQNIAFNNVQVASDYVSGELIYGGAYQQGLFASGGVGNCSSETALFSFDGEVFELVSSGPEVSRNMTTARTYGVSTAGISTTSVRYTLTGEEYNRIMNASRVVIQYCGITSQVRDESLLELQGRNYYNSYSE